MGWKQHKEDISNFIQSMQYFLIENGILKSYKIVLHPHPDKGPYETYDKATEDFLEMYGSFYEDEPKGKEFFNRYIRTTKHNLITKISIILKKSEKEGFKYCINATIFTESCEIPWHSVLDFSDLVDATDAISQIESIFNEKQFLRFKQYLRIHQE